LKYYNKARKSSNRRKNPLNLCLLFLSFTIWAATIYFLFRLVWLFHVTLYPGHRLSDFGQPGIGVRSALLSVLMVVSLFPGSGATAFMITNSMFWFIPQLRKIFVDEAEKYPGTDYHFTMRKLATIWLWTFPSGVTVSLIAAVMLKRLN